jgi:GDP-4-dehydro-6-deoxy-D-mannose reductase
MRLFLTGSKGFVGGWARRLEAAVFIPHRFEIVHDDPETDIGDAAALQRTLRQARPGAILHLAALSNVLDSFRDPARTFETNLLGTLNLLTAARSEGIAPRIVFVSSGDAYGLVRPDELPIRETLTPRPRNPYAVSKFATEALCWQWTQTEGADIVIARPFNHIGPGQSDAFVLPALARQIAEIKAGKRAPVIETGDIDVTRDFTDVRDVIPAYLTLLEKGARGDAYNICSGSEHSIRDLLAQMLEMAGIEAEVRQDPARMRPAEQRRVRGDNAKIRALGWQPAIDIRTSLRDILQDWEERVANG